MIFKHILKHFNALVFIIVLEGMDGWIFVKKAVKSILCPQHDTKNGYSFVLSYFLTALSLSFGMME